MKNADLSRLPNSHKLIINHLIMKFTENSNIESIFLFGSCAKGTANKESDIDIFVVTKNEIYDDSQEAYEILYSSTDDIPLEEYISCDILTATKNDFSSDLTPLIRTVKREGVELRGILQ